MWLSPRWVVPIRRLGLADLAAQQRVDQRRLAGRARPEDDDVELAALAAGADLAEFPVQLGLDLLVADLTDHALRLVGLHRGGLDHVGRDRYRGRPAPPYRDRQASRPNQRPRSPSARSGRSGTPAPGPAIRRANRSCISLSELTSQAASPIAAPTRMTVNAT